jgi:hypothetical protein
MKSKLGTVLLILIFSNMWRDIGFGFGLPGDLPD